MTCADVLTPSWCTQETEFKQRAAERSGAAFPEPPALLLSVYCCQIKQQEAECLLPLFCPWQKPMGKEGLWSHVQAKALQAGTTEVRQTIETSDDKLD